MGPDVALIRVINPNSNQAVTDGLADSLAGFTVPGIEILCETLEEGPFGIETDAHVAEVAEPVLARMQARPADAYVIACYSDPGLALCREHVALPVYGIMESAIMSALARGGQFGVIALSEASIARHVRAIRAMGVESRLAAERPIGVSVAESGGDAAFGALLKAGELLRDADGARVVILGCAGMAPQRARLQDRLGLPVVDPTQAAVGLAISAILANRA